MLVGPPELILAQAGIVPEGFAAHRGVLFARREHDEGRHYFIANQSVEPMAGWFALATPARSAVAMDPLSGRTGVAATRMAADGRLEVRLDLAPGHSLLLRTFAERQVAGPPWQPATPGEQLAALAGPWQVEFVEGGPALPRPWTAQELVSWTANGDPATEAFSGTARYQIRFDRPASSGDLLLELGEVKHTARVRLNGHALGTLIMHPYRLTLPAERLQAGSNRLEIEVTSLGANRLRDLDRRKIPWRKFYFVNIDYRPLDAASWPVEPSGLLGPVTLHAIVP